MTRCQFCFYWGWRKDLTVAPKPCGEIENQLAGKNFTGPDDTCDKHSFYDRWAEHGNAPPLTEKHEVARANEMPERVETKR